MKIRKVTPDIHPKVSALLRQAFPDSTNEALIVDSLHNHNKIIYEWICIHINMVIAHIAFSKAYKGTDVCGLHLGTLAVKPEFQNRGIGSELLRFSLRQEPIKDSTIFVFGPPAFYNKFGFEPCSIPTCTRNKKGCSFLSMRNNESVPFTVGYEQEFIFAAPKINTVSPSNRRRR
ncbi:MAG: N-acetyltransferase [Desulfobulbaceae bacterium]|nr:N-acetyltransferase [Desulfobulbaceae bacterium]